MITTTSRYRPLSHRLARLDIQVEDRNIARLQALLMACDSYPEFESSLGILRHRRPGCRELSVTKHIDPMLLKLKAMPGGINALLEAVGCVPLNQHFHSGDADSHTSLDESVPRGPVGDYARKVYEALTASYTHLWYFHPEELVRAEEERREPMEDQDAFDDGAFRACNAIADAYFKPKRGKARS